MMKPTCAKFDKWRQAKKPVKLVQQEDARENKKCQDRSDQAALKLRYHFEFTTKCQHQQNSIAE